MSLTETEGVGGGVEEEKEEGKKRVSRKRSDITSDGSVCLFVTFRS